MTDTGREKNIILKAVENMKPWITCPSKPGKSCESPRKGQGMLLGRNMCELLRLPVEVSVSYNRCKIKCIDDNLKPQDAAGK